ncbi:MAG: AtpZ/AtpI family protein [Magnetococcales bacterium]|nr:AtpZ/AtpI family protein [Magnetococcales bacterium]
MDSKDHHTPPEGEPTLNSKPPPAQGYQWAIRIATELASSIAIGIGIGYGLDRWLDTRPWLTLTFLLFGVAAGFLNLYRAVKPPDA